MLSGTGCQAKIHLEFLVNPHQPLDYFYHHFRDTKPS